MRGMRDEQRRRKVRTKALWSGRNRPSSDRRWTVMETGHSDVKSVLWHSKRWVWLQQHSATAGSCIITINKQGSSLVLKKKKSNKQQRPTLPTVTGI